MPSQFLSEYFQGVCSKQLSAVEANPTRSHQHEINGTNALKQLLGESEVSYFQGLFIYFKDGSPPLGASGTLTWYDARAAHKTRSEHRLYYQSNEVSRIAAEGDTLFIALRNNNEILFVVTEKDSTFERQLGWLFDLKSTIGTQFSFESAEGIDVDSFAARYILDELGVSVKSEPTDLETLQLRFDSEFPDTRTFSAFAREQSPHASDFQTPDQALLAWMTREDSLFRQFEKFILEDQLNSEFGGGKEIDVDAFVARALSVINRRKARVGLAFENHLEEIFVQSNIRYSREQATELRKKPDFVFPGIQEYRAMDYPQGKLSMLGVKYSCKDRWRQVLTEAARIETKHLITMEPAISISQTNQMQNESLQLVIPTELHNTYASGQREWLLDLTAFMSMVSNNQKQ